jgi:hypothetical protein
MLRAVSGQGPTEQGHRSHSEADPAVTMTLRSSKTSCTNRVPNSIGVARPKGEQKRILEALRLELPERLSPDRIL